MATNSEKKKSNCKPSVYFCARPYSSPVLTDVTKCLSRHVSLRARHDDPESAYLTIYESDTFVFYLNPETAQQLFALYELGVAVVFEKPVIMVRDADLTFSQLQIPLHFYKTDILVPRNWSSIRHKMLTKRRRMLSLGGVLVRGFENAVTLSPADGLSTRAADELLNRVFLSSGPFSHHAPDITLQDLQISSIKSIKKPAVKPIKTVRNHERKVLSKEKDSFSEIEPTLQDAKRVTQETMPFLCTQTNYMHTNSNESTHPTVVEFPGKVDNIEVPREDAQDDESEQCTSLHTYDMVALDVEVSISTVTPLPSTPIVPLDIYYPTALPINPMNESFPPFKIEDLDFDEHAIAIARSDRLPSIIRRRLMRKSS